MTDTPSAPRPLERRRRDPKPLEVVVTESTEPMDFAAWADHYAAVVLRLQREDQATSGPPLPESVQSRL